ncbi:MAG: DNA primase [Chloroflexi bacterium]|nr:DNA primase [Chloroflexota bacterium]
MSDVVQTIKERLSLVEYVGAQVPLRKSSDSFLGLCPFHNEKTPSFRVFPDNHYHCYGCGAHGDIFTYVQQTQNLDFAESLRLLADLANVALPDRRAGVDDNYGRLRELVEAAAQYYHNLLLSSAAGAEARDYLAQRGVTDATRERFQLGYAPNEWNALERYLAGKGYSVAELAAAGLLVEREAEGDAPARRWDRFRHRLLFPIRDRKGRLTGFGGRAFGDAMPKYLNSPQTALFDKGGTLYGLDQAHAAIRERDQAVIVEGYMDVVVAHQCGERNVVAALGTALGERQIEQLRLLTRRLILALDPDAAGEEATVRGLEVALQYLRRAVPRATSTGRIVHEAVLDAEVRILSLPDDKDPDEVLLEDAERWRQLVATAKPFVEFFFDRARRRHDLADPKARMAARDELLPVLASLDEIERQHYLEQLATVVKQDVRGLQTRLRALLVDERTRRVPRTDHGRSVADSRWRTADGGRRTADSSRSNGSGLDTRPAAADNYGNAAGSQPHRDSSDGATAIPEAGATERSSGRHSFNREDATDSSLARYLLAHPAWLAEPEVTGAIDLVEDPSCRALLQLASAHYARFGKLDAEALLATLDPVLEELLRTLIALNISAPQIALSERQTASALGAVILRLRLRELNRRIQDNRESLMDSGGGRSQEDLKLLMTQHHALLRELNELSRSGARQSPL